MDMSHWNMRLYVGVLALIGGAIALGLLGDLFLALSNRPTITAFLREHTEYFWIPARVVVVALVVLALHLFLVPEIMALWNHRP